jgi:type II secretory pathway component PulM
VRATTAIGISGIEAGLRAAGLREVVSELANTTDGGITLRFDAVRFTALADWLSGQSGVWGYDLAGFAFERGAREDVVAADLRLVPAR